MGRKSTSKLMDPNAQSPLETLVGKRRPLGIGISVDDYKRDYLTTPPKEELLKWSPNPRNATGKWYENEIQTRLTELNQKHGWITSFHAPLGYSKVHLTEKFVDVLVNHSLGLELKFLNVEGSLIRPKALIDALDFSNRSVHCIYVVDGPAWLSGGKRAIRNMSNLEYLANWWEFTCAKHLESTITKFIEKERKSS